MRIKTLLCLLCLGFALMSCGGSGASENENNLAALDNKEKRYFSNGQRLYAIHCQNCHLDKGQGFGKLMPPLRQSDYLLADMSRAARIIKYGLEGPITVNGVDYNQPMPAFKNLKNLEIAELLTFIGNSWGNATGAISIGTVEEAIKQAKQP